MTIELLLSAARPQVVRFLLWISNGSEAGIIEKEEVDRIFAEYQQQRNLALASDIELIREGMGR